MSRVLIGDREVGPGTPTYFIADIGSNHDGSLARAKELVWAASEIGADCAKFQHYRAEQLVSDRGFKELGSIASHQQTWTGSVFDVYNKASVPWDWTEELVATADEAGIDFMSTPYDLEALTYLSEFQHATKIGSGDIDWLELIAAARQEGKPVLLATGAAELVDVDRAMKILESGSSPVVLMQCNTNYEGNDGNLDYLNLRVLSMFQARYPGVVLGLSDHTRGHVGVLGAVSLGASVIEKHLTDDNTKQGPDHSFALNLEDWRSMIHDVRSLERALGDGVKRVEDNEKQTRVVQRRAIRAARAFAPGDVIKREDITVLRPAPAGSLGPTEISQVVGRAVVEPVEPGQLIVWSIVEH